MKIKKKGGGSLTFALMSCAVILMICVASSKALYRFGVPTLLIFLLLGMLSGSDGLVGIPFDNFDLAENLCSVALIFIMFYGGFGTNWRAARPVALPAILMSSLGVVATAGLTGLFCHYALHMDWLTGFLVGSVVGSTDAASVFSILRSKKLNLKGGLASLLELESGSNDPVAYMLTAVFLSFLSPEGGVPVAKLLILQIVFGLAVGLLVSFAAIQVLKRVNFEINGLHTIFVVAAALFAYAAAGLMGGNGYLSVYLLGILLGNSKILHKQSLVHFFDGLTWMMQIGLFFILGLLSFPSRMPRILPDAAAISIFLMLVARPAAAFGILCWFRIPFRSLLLISWSGLRGAASIVFAIFVMNSGVSTGYDIFHIVFVVALSSVAIQGTLLPHLAKKLQLVDGEGSVFKTFNDYQDETGTQLIEVPIADGHPFGGKMVMELDLPEDVLIVLVKRGSEILVPRGSTLIRAGDVLVLNGADFSELPDVLRACAGVVTVSTHEMTDE